MEQRLAPNPSPGPTVAFPSDPSEFDADDRISFSKLDNKFVLVTEDGTEFEFDDALKRWVSTVDEALLEEQQKAYRVSGVDENEPVEAIKKKRKKEYVNGEDVRICSVFPVHEVKLIGYNIGRRKSSQSPEENKGTPSSSRKYSCLCYRPTI